MIRYVSHTFRMTLWRPLTSASTWRKNFLKAKVLAVCATAVQSRILGPTKLLRFETSSHNPMIHVLLIEHLSKLSNISFEDTKKGSPWVTWSPSWGTSLFSTCNFQVSEPEQHILWAFGSAWSSWEFSMKLGHVQFLGFSRFTRAVSKV